MTDIKTETGTKAAAMVKYNGLASSLSLDWSGEQIAILHHSVAKGTNLTEFAYFLSVAKAQGLNPINKEVWCYKDNKGNVIIFASKDGWYKKAQGHHNFNGIRHGVVRANDDFSIDQPNGIIEVKITKATAERGEIIYGWSKVFLKSGEEHIEIVDFATYNKNQFVWKSHPESMIMKVADTHAIKFSLGFSNLHLEEDFDIVKSGGGTVAAALGSTGTVEVLETITEERFDKFLQAGVEYVEAHQTDYDFNSGQQERIDELLAGA